MANLRSTPRAFERPPGIVALAGSAIGSALIVLVLFAVLLMEEPPWIHTWVAGCGVVLVASGAWAWLRPPQLPVASRLGLVAATVGLALGSPALALWLRASFTDQALVRPDFAVFAAVTSILCACYLSFLGADLVRSERIAADEYRARLAARPPARPLRPSTLAT